MVVVIDDLGGRVNLVGLCQSSWLSTMIAARFPDKVHSLVLDGAPIDTDAGDGPIKRMAKASPMSFYVELVELGGGLMKGKFMLQGWKNIHPAQRYIQDHIDLYEHVDDPGAGLTLCERVRVERKRHSPEDIVAKLRQVEALRSRGRYVR